MKTDIEAIANSETWVVIKTKNKTTDTEGIANRKTGLVMNTVTATDE